MAEERIWKGDTALIEAVLYDEDEVTPLQASTVEWSVRKPDGTLDNSVAPITIDNTEVTITYPTTTLAGLYTMQATFTMPGGNKKSVVRTFEVIDPLQTTYDSTTDSDHVIDRAWMKLEDLWDSSQGGPWLRDKSKAFFSRDKMAMLLEDALYNVNATYQPPTGYDITSFPYAQHTPLLAEALLIESIYHMIRSYVEQPMPMGGEVTYLDRRDYVNRWQSVLQIEEPKYLKWLDMFKRELMGYGGASILLGGYAQTYYAPRYMRGRYPFAAVW